MKALIIATIFTLATLHSWAQSNVDSLRAVINSSRPYEQQIDASIRLLENLETTNVDSVLIEGNKALKLARKNKDSVSVAEVKRHLGLASYSKGLYEVAARNYHESIAILEKMDVKIKLAPVYSDLAKLYRMTRDLDKATAAFKQAENIFRQLKDTSGISMILNESGLAYEYKADYKEALSRYTNSLKLAETQGDSIAVSNALRNIAGVNLIEKKYDEAERSLLRALAIRQQLKDSLSIAQTYADLGAAMNDKGDFAKANNYLYLSNALASKLHYAELQSNNYTELAELAQKQGDFQKAYDYYLKRSYLRDSILAVEKAKQIEDIRNQYEASQKQQEVEQQNEKLRLQNYIFIGIGGLILLTALLVHSQYRKNKLRQETRLQAQLLAQQEQAVKAVIEAEENERQRIAKDLHDGVGQMMSAAKMNLSAFESRNSFDDPEQKQTFDKIIQLVDESCREVRTVSHVMMPNALLKNNLATAIREFVDKLSHKNLQVHVHTIGIDERMDSAVETVLYRVVQECVTNALKHAGATTLDISIAREKDGITGTIEDNGKGFSPNEIGHSDGIGLKNIISRIEYLKGTVDFDSSPGRGTVVAFHVPV